MSMQPQSAPMMPDVTRLPLDKVRKLLALQGLAVGDIRFEDNAALLEENVVLQQHPQPGDLLPKSAQVALTLFRKSYLNLLPGVMQKEDERAGGVLKSILWIVQHLMAGFQEKISRLPQCFNPHTAPPDFLPWLSGWMAVELEEHWPEEQRRLFLSHAVELFKWRGTKQGLINCIRILSGEAVDIEEHRVPFENLTLGGNFTLGIKSLLYAKACLEHWFTVRMPKRRETYTPDFLMKIHRIIASEKPAHTQYFLAFEEPKAHYQALIPWLLGETVLGEGWVS